MSSFNPYKEPSFKKNSEYNMENVSWWNRSLLKEPISQDACLIFSKIVDFLSSAWLCYREQNHYQLKQDYKSNLDDHTNYVKSRTWGLSQSCGKETSSKNEDKVAISILLTVLIIPQLFFCDYGHE